MDEIERIGNKIYAQRKIKGVSQDKMAEDIGVSRQTIYQWEKDIVYPKIEHFNKICNYFKVDTVYFQPAAAAITNGETAVAEIPEHVEENEVVEAEIIEVADESVRAQKRERRKIKALVAFIVICSIIFLIMAIDTICVGFVIFSPTNKNAIAINIYKIDYNVFLAFLLPTLIVFLLDLYLIVRLKKESNRVNTK